MYARCPTFVQGSFGVVSLNVVKIDIHTLMKIAKTCFGKHYVITRVVLEH